MDREKVIKGLEHCRLMCEGVSHNPCNGCPYQGYQGCFDCADKLKTDALELLKEQETTSTVESRLFHCEKCGYGIDDIYLSNEHDFDIYPHYCPNCGRSVK